MSEEIYQLDRQLDSVQHLPPTPALMIELLEIFKEPDRDIDRIVELLKHDPPVTAEVLKRCNSAFFGREEPVSSISAAVARVGFYEIYRAVAGMLGSQIVSIPGDLEGSQVEALWQHSVTTAVIAGIVARHMDESEAEAFTAGLLHDVGKVILACLQGPTYAHLRPNLCEGGRAMSEQEKDRFGFDHSQIGARLLARWNLPPSLVVAVLHHHDLSPPKAFERLTAIVVFADQIAHQDLGSKLVFDTSPELRTSVAALQLTPEAALSILSSAPEELEQVQAFLGHPVPVAA